MSLLAKARSRPDQVRKVLDTVAQQGLRSAYTKAMNRLDSYTPLGYSSCGVVVEVGRGAEEFTLGQLVACAGNEYALHAEVNWVPVNLCVPVPDGVSAPLAAFATVGAIAMHGVRRAEAQLGTPPASSGSAWSASWSSSSSWRRGSGSWVSTSNRSAAGWPKRVVPWRVTRPTPRGSTGSSGPWPS